MLPEPSVRPHLDGKRWSLINDFIISLELNNEYVTIVIPHGFIFDFASIPKPFRWLFQPATGKHRIPALVHDWLYYIGSVFMLREEADLVFYNLMIIYGTPKWKAYLMYTAVRMGGSSSWNKRKDSKNG